MAPRLSGPARVLLAGAALSLLVAACTSPDRPSVQPDEVVLPTPMRSFDAAVSRTVAQLEAAMTAAGERLVESTGPYRPSEPASLMQLPRAVMRVDLADPDDGYVVIYRAGSAAAARDRAAELADYLGSGFGQTNFLPDTQFAVAVLGETVIFTSWSRRGSSDPDRAEAAFDAVATVGEAVEVQK